MKKYSIILNYLSTVNGVDLYSINLKKWDLDAEGNQINIDFILSSNNTIETAQLKIKDFTDGK
jgi:hypothetical protein